MYIDPSESNNRGKGGYNIVSNTTSSITLDQVIEPYYEEDGEQISDVYVGQSVKFIPSRD